MALVALTVAPAASAGQQSASLEGAWDSQVTNTDCNGNIFAEFRSFEIFHQGGTFTGTGNLSSPALGGPALGTWQLRGMRTFNASFQFFTFNPDGSFAGTLKVTSQIHLSADGNSFTSTDTFAIYDPDGNLVFSSCGTEVATRLP
ncbi:MAG: hypothetical protein ACR2II_00930 [Chthoniobacterales bacterium]